MQKKLSMSSPAANEALFSGGVLLLYLISPAIFVVFSSGSAPYGKHFRRGWGPTIPFGKGWFLMGSPTLWLPLLLAPSGRHVSNPIALFVLSLYIIHYVHRTLIYPICHRRTPAPLYLFIFVLSFSLQSIIAYVQTRSATHYADYGGRAWTAGALTAARVAIGSWMFFWGMALNVKADLALGRLKEENGGKYGIPRGGWFEKVSCPNYMGELVEWAGWALVAWSPAAWGLVLVSAAFLVPRARSHHIWYLNKYQEDYPKSRTAIIPFIF